jgi:hypothetical protein
MYFGDLWNTIAYTECHTVFTPATRRQFLKPRQCYDDPDSGAQPVEARYSPAQNEKYMTRLRNIFLGQCVRNASGQWVEDAVSAQWAALDRAAVTCFPAPLRDHALVLVMSFSPYYLHQLTPDERACYDAVNRCTVRHLANLNFASLAFGADCAAADYADHVHLAASGGAKLAEAVAAQVRVMAHRLGYVKQGEEP